MRKTEGITLGGEAVRLTFSKIITLIITMATTMLLSRFRTLEEYGTYSQILLVINLFTSLLMLGLPNSINYFLARAETQYERQRFLSVYYTLSTIISIVIGIVLVLATPIIESYFHNPLIGKFYYFLALYPWASIITSSIENVLVVFKKTDFLMIYRFIVSTITLGTVLIVQWGGWGFSGYMILFVIIHCLFAISVYTIVSFNCGGLKLSINLPLIRRIFEFSIPIGLATVIGTLNTEIDKLLIGYLMDTEQMSIYTNAARELPLTIVAGSITAVLLPQLTRMVKNNNTEDAIKLWSYSTEISFIAMSVLVAGIFTFAEDVMCILYSEKYLPGVSVFRMYTLNLLLRVTYFGIVLNAFGETKKIFYCSVFSLALNSALNPLMYYFFGMIGPAAATFLALLIIVLLQLKMTSNITEIPYSRVFPWKECGLVLSVNIGLSILFKVVKQILPIDQVFGETIESIILGLIWAGGYFFIMKKRLFYLWHKLNRGGSESYLEHSI